jgi:hypothetical protein
MDDDDPHDEPDEPAGSPDGEARELARRSAPPLGRTMLVMATAMLAPPVIAGIAGSLALAIAVGVLSIFAGLLGFAIFVYGTEHWQRRRPERLPRARARLRR